MGQHKKQSGFTLLEMVLALALLATISVVSLQISQGILRSSSQLREKSLRLMQQQFAFAVMENDFSHMLLHPDSGIANETPVKSSDPVDGVSAGKPQGRVRFLRGNWLNPGGLLKRSQTERVTYRLSQGALEKVSTPWRESMHSGPPNVITLLTGVSAFHLRYYLNNQWTEELDMLQALPKAVAVTLKLDGGEEFRRVYLVTKS